MDPAFLPPCVTQLNGLNVVRARRYSACRSRHENWQKRGIPGTLIFLAFNTLTPRIVSVIRPKLSYELHNFFCQKITKTIPQLS